MKFVIAIGGTNIKVQGMDLNVNRKQARKNQSQKLQKIVTEAIEVLDDYWIYDTAQLLQDGAVATARIARLLDRIKRKPHQFVGRERDLTNEVSELVQFLKELDQEAARNVRLSFSCPDGVEEHLKSLANVVDPAVRVTRATRDSEFSGDQHSSLEPPIWIPARRFRTDKRIKKG
jgi:hypothetical protein